MPNGDYLPAAQGPLLSWSQNLYYKLTAAPADFGATPEEVAPFATAQEAFKAAMATTNNPSTRTGPATQEKNLKKKAMIETIRPLVAAIQASPVMTDTKRDELQIPIRDDQPTPVPVPAEMPVLNVTSVSGRLINLQLLNKDMEKRRPTGAKQVYLYWFAGPNPSENLQAWRFEGSSTLLNPQIVVNEDVVPGTKIWLTAQWVNPTGRTGPACAPVESYTNHSGLSAAA